ncbi:alpha/beta hydrolase [Roseinatronobacter sp.]|uniref:alpha/beta hydrolase n=1 Tax=Roseinatronobacter sp. TaxID=1945755 RepID=UPI0025D716DC|nr:alpha/beta hydrolase [Rhodobaca sp.]
MLTKTMRIITVLAATLSIVLSLGVLFFVAGVFLDPTGGRIAVIGASVWTTFGPHLFLASVASFLVALFPGVLSRRPVGMVVPFVSVAACVGSGFIVFKIMSATISAGGSVNLPLALVLADMESARPDAVETVRVVAGTELQAAIYQPVGAANASPVLVYIHGGGFMTGHRTETAADLRWFADKGWLVVSVDYRLFAPDLATWDKALRDAACGLIWAQRNAARFGGDPERIALLGDSAGGNLAINIGFAAADRLTIPECGGEMPVPMAIATQYPAVDPVSIYESGFPIPGFEPMMLIEGYIGGTPADYPGRIAEISSRTYLTPNAPPTLVILPERDSLVVAEGTLAFAAEARDAGVDLELVRMPFASHIYNQIAANSLGNQSGRTIRLRFLEQHLR